MISVLLSLISGAVSSISNVTEWVKNKQLTNLGAQAQEATSLQDQDEDDTKVTQIRDKSFASFDRASSSNRLPNDSEIRK